MRIGYARVSTEDQCADLQISALRQAGCERIYLDQGISGSRLQRPGLNQALQQLSAGDTLVVWKLDRLGRSLKHLVELVEKLGFQNVQFLCVSEAIDTTSPAGTLIFHVIGAMAQFERALTIERTLAGLRAARARGRHPGRPRSLSENQIQELGKLIEDGKLDEKKAANQFMVHPRTIKRYVNKKNPFTAKN